jgi:hypothetical protein
MAAGLFFILKYCHGSASFNAAFPAAGASLQVSVTTTGLPAMVGFALTVLGVGLLLWALVAAIVGHFHSPSDEDMPRGLGLR